jgi:hypothetical protein
MIQRPRIFDPSFPLGEVLPCWWSGAMTYRLRRR